LAGANEKPNEHDGVEAKEKMTTMKMKKKARTKAPAKRDA
jgi:hypothetical protein